MCFEKKSSVRKNVVLRRGKCQEKKCSVVSRAGNGLSESSEYSVNVMLREMLWEKKKCNVWKIKVVLRRC